MFAYEYFPVSARQMVNYPSLNMILSGVDGACCGDPNSSPEAVHHDNGNQGGERHFRAVIQCAYIQCAYIREVWRSYSDFRDLLLNLRDLNVHESIFNK